MNQPRNPDLVWERLWYGQHPLGLLLVPLSWLYCTLAVLRRRAYRTGVLPVTRLGVPVIVVGNIVVGGTGKTPLVIWIAGFLARRGFRPGVVCRGYGGSAGRRPQLIGADSDPGAVGDEAVLLARRAGCPVAVGIDRVAAARLLLDHGCDVVVSDDGLQHLRLHRDVEIAVVDAARRHGTGRCLPAGPLREPVSRLHEVDLVVAHGEAAPGEFGMVLQPCGLRGVADEERRSSIESMPQGQVHALCGIGNPSRFFAALRARGLVVIAHAFADHHRFTRADIEFGDQLPVLMTEKDAVKCRSIADARHWYVYVEARLPREFGERLLALLENPVHGQEAP